MFLVLIFANIFVNNNVAPIIHIYAYVDTLTYMHIHRISSYKSNHRIEENKQFKFCRFLTDCVLPYKDRAKAYFYQPCMRILLLPNSDNVQLIIQISAKLLGEKKFYLMFCVSLIMSGIIIAYFKEQMFPLF